jgi:hypothetical protein
MMANQKSKSAGPNKKEFILSRADMSAKEVVDAAAKENLKLTTGYVYVVRSQATVKARASKTAGKKAARKGARKAVKAQKLPRAKARRAVAAPRITQGANHSTQFVDLVLEIGLARAEALLREMRKLGPSISARA